MSEMSDIIAAGRAAAAGAASPIFLPPVTWPSSAPTGVVAARTLKKTATPPEERQATVAAAYALIPILYGRQRLGAKILNVLRLSGYWIIQAVWCRGECDALESYTLDDKAPPADITATHYLGTATQAVDALLVSAFAALAPPITYTDTLPGICYSVFLIPEKAISSFPNLAAIIRGLKCYDSRLDSTNGGAGAQRLVTPATWTYTENPSLHEADLLKSPVYGDGKTLRWSTVAAAADANDTMVGSGPDAEPQRTSAMLLDTEQDVADWVETMRAAAACWVIDNAGVVSLVPDLPAASVATYDWDAGQIISITRLKKRDPANMPTVMTVIYTDASTVPWREGRATVYAAGVLAGTTPYRPSDVQMPWITRHSQAFREATERMNKLSVSDLSFTMKVFDDGLANEKGDVITVNAPVHGITAKDVRIDNVRALVDGWEMDLVEYDPAAYSRVVVSGPTYPDTNLPSPNAPPTPTDLVLAEEVYALPGPWSYASLIKVSFDASTWPFVHQYQVAVYSPAGIVDYGFVPVGPTPEYRTRPLPEGVLYTVDVSIIATDGSVSAVPAADTITLLGHDLLAAVAPPTALIVTEELYETKDGAVASRFVMTWTAPADYYQIDYWISISDPTHIVASGYERDPAFTYEPLADAITYTINVYAERILTQVRSVALSGSKVALGKLAPPGDVNLFSATVGLTGLILTWSTVVDIDMKGYAIQEGAIWTVAGTLLASLAQTITTVNLGYVAIGAHTYQIKALDWSRNESANAKAVSITLAAPAQPVPAVAISGPNAVVSWAAVASSYPIDHYEIRSGASWGAGVAVATSYALSTTVRVTGVGALNYWVAAVDVAGNIGSAGMASITVTAPLTPTLTVEVIGNNVLLRWSDAAATLPIDRYEIRKGASWAAGTLLGTLLARFSAFFESAAGTYTYWVAGIDSAGNVGVAASASALVAQPPDFQLLYDQSSAFAGTKTNCLVDSGALIANINTTETWEAHFTSHGWTTPQDQINAGYPIFIEPGLPSGSYEEVIDYGTTVASTLIAAILDSVAVAGSVTMTPKISVSNISGTGPWTDYAGVSQAYVTAFRWFKIRYDFTSAGGANVVKITNLRLKLSFKLRTDAGSGTAVSTDTGGTVVLFNVAFVDVSSISVSPVGTTAIIAIYDFVDAPNPTQFKVLLFNTAGTRVSGAFSWSAKGV
jgi:Putative phage tail protein